MNQSGSGPGSTPSPDLYESNEWDVSLDSDRRAHHNALERKRRNHIKDSFLSLREVVPNLKGEKASRAIILKKAASYITSLRLRCADHQKNIQSLKDQISHFEQLVESAKYSSPEALNQSQEVTYVTSSNADIRSPVATPACPQPTVAATAAAEQRCEESVFSNVVASEVVVKSSEDF